MNTKTFGKHIEVFIREPSEVFPDRVRHGEVSWASIGSVSVDEAEQFESDLADAITYAKTII